MENLVNGGKWGEISRKQIELGTFQCASLDIKRSFNCYSDPTDPSPPPKKRRKKKKRMQRKRKEELEILQFNSYPPHASPVIFKSRVAEQRLITGAEGKAKFFGPERRGTRQARGICVLSATGRQGSANVFIFWGIIKRVVQHPWRTPVDRTKVGNNVSDTTLVWLCPEESALHPLSPPARAPSHPFRPPTPSPPLPRSPPAYLPLYACPPQIQTPN